MDKFALYTANAATEGVMLVMLAVLLVSAVVQKKNFAATRLLLQLTVANIALLFCQIAEWLIMQREYFGPLPNVLLLKRVTYTLDYALYYVTALCFFRYLSAYISELSASSGGQKAYPVRWVRFLAVWGAVISVVFGVLIWDPRFYYFDAAEGGREMFNLPLYGLMFVFGTFCVISSSIALIRNRALLKDHGFWLLLAYVIVPNVVAGFDVIYGLCVSYLLMAFFVLILYIEIDLRRGSMILEQTARLSAQEVKLSELRTRIMLSQMQPHFLYNTLSTISALCYLENAQQAKQVVDRFSDYFRQNLDSLGKDDFVPFEKELEHIRTYLWLEQVRFGDALTVEYDIGPTDFTIPPLTLQPLAENAVKHGIRKKKGGGTVTVETRETPEEYILTVRDDGAGFDPSVPPNDGKSHIGIKNITERLEMLCGGRLEIESQKGAGTAASVHIPKRPVSSKKASEEAAK